ncbi:MAG: ABC transporter ATP-binding protein, partial [Acidobacteriota bacterium]|nr:ABC transporter ATP-binding protein [Acidobacteriota bacterium]
DLRIAAGELFSLVGPDGAGKTTLIRMLCGILRPTSGRALVLGGDAAAVDGAAKSRLGYLSQRFSLYGDLTVDENIEFFAEIHGQRDFRTRREELLAFTRLTPFRARLADRLSGGMKQKLALACTLIHRPQLLLLDEPTTGVDPVSRREFWTILSDLLRTGITILMTTPYLDEAERSSRVGLLDHGRLVAADTPQAVKALMPGQVAELVCDETRRAYFLLRGRPEFDGVQIFGDRIHVVAASAERARPEAAGILAGAGIEIRSWRIIPPSLENVFIAVTRTSGQEHDHESN